MSANAALCGEVVRVHAEMESLVVFDLFAVHVVVGPVNDRAGIRLDLHAASTTIGHAA